MSGCSSIAVHDPINNAQNKVLKISYCVKSTSGMDTIQDALSDDENKKEFDVNIKLAVKRINEYIESNIYHSPDIFISALPECIDSTESDDIDFDFHLTIELSGYGSIKKEWKRVLIGTGIAEGLIQGFIVGAATQNPWLGFGVLAEEIGQEYLTWNGVDWILGETYAPVTLEGSLFYLKDKKVIWKDSFFITENEENLSEDEKKDKSKQLNASLRKAESDLISSLNSYLKNEIIKKHNKPIQGLRDPHKLE